MIKKTIFGLAASLVLNEELKSLDFAALMSGDKTAALSEITTHFPNAKVEIVEVNEGALKCTDTAKFYRLKLSVK